MQNVRYDRVLGIKMNKTSFNGMNLLSYGGTLKLVIGWQKKKKSAQLPWDANSIAEQLKVGAEWNWSPYSGKSLSLQRQTLAWARLDFLLAVKTGSSHLDGIQNCGHAARPLQILTSLGATAKQSTSANILFWLSDERLPTTASQTNAPSSGKKLFEEQRNQNGRQRARCCCCLCS